MILKKVIVVGFGMREGMRMVRILVMVRVFMVMGIVIVFVIVLIFKMVMGDWIRIRTDELGPFVPPGRVGEPRMDIISITCEGPMVWDILPE